MQEERRRQLQQKIKLEAKNKILIRQRIEKYENERFCRMRRVFTMWSAVLVERRKQTGLAMACYDWRVTRTCFDVWRRHCRKERESRLVQAERERAKTIQHFQHNALLQK